jgi:hypothetical protein
MREFLILSPINVVLSAFIVIVMISARLVSESFLEPNLDVVKLSGGLSPSMVVLIEHVVQLDVLFE